MSAPSHEELRQTLKAELGPAKFYTLVEYCLRGESLPKYFRQFPKTCQVAQDLAGLHAALRICPLHERELQPQVVNTLLGRVDYTDAYYEAKKEQFPYAEADWAEMEDEPRPEHRLELLFCPACRERHAAFVRMLDPTPLIQRSEIVTVADGSGTIDVRGGKFDVLLCSHGTPLVLNWDDCQGSVAQYLIRSGKPFQPLELDALRHTLEGHLDDERPLAEQFALFLRLLANGTYKITYELLTQPQKCIEFAQTACDESHYEEYYPDGLDLVATQATDTLDDERIGHFQKIIRAGGRPIVLAVTTENAFCAFLVDGHHKFAAYSNFQVGPALLTVCRMDAPKLEPGAFDRHFTPTHPLAEHYRKHKAKQP